MNAKLTAKVNTATRRALEVYAEESFDMVFPVVLEPAVQALVTSLESHAADGRTLHKALELMRDVPNPKQFGAQRRIVMLLRGVGTKRGDRVVLHADIMRGAFDGCGYSSTTLCTALSDLNNPRYARECSGRLDVVYDDETGCYTASAAALGL